MNGCFFKHCIKVYRKIWDGFCPNTGKYFFLEISFWTQQKEHRVFYKTVLMIFEIALTVTGNFGRFQHLNFETNFL